MREEHSPGRDRRQSGGVRSLIEPRFLSSFALNGGGSVSGRRSSYLKLPPQYLIKISVVTQRFPFRCGSRKGLLGGRAKTSCGRGVYHFSSGKVRAGFHGISSVDMKVGEFHIVETMSFTLIFAYRSHVWGHFCLCYRDQRLVNDKTSTRYLGLNDGDQLHFVRHLSIDNSPVNKISKSPSCKRYLQLEVESNATQIQIQNQNQNTVDNVASDKCYPGAEDELPAAEFRLVNLIKGWLPYARHWGVSRKGPDGRIGPSKFSLKHFGGRPKM